MTTYIALIRAVNVGGTGKLPMADLKAMCEDAGLEDVRTYIASGNVVFRSDESETALKAALKPRLEAYAGKPVGVLIRTGKEMAAVLAANPFKDAPPNRVAVMFLDKPPPTDTLEGVAGQADEEIALGARELYVRYPSGMGKSKLKIGAAAAATGRSMNTVAKLVEMARDPD
jgi:uncharacterized protein (DUF1697 family)